MGRSAAIEAVSEHLGELTKVEEALMAAAAEALQVRPADRKDFDMATVDAVSAALAAHAEGLDKQIAEGAPQELQVSSEALGFWALVDVVRDQWKGATRAAGEARTAAETAKAV